MIRCDLALVLCVATAATRVFAAADESAGQCAADLAPPVRVMSEGAPIEVDGFAAPFVGDFDGDGRNDLLVGQSVLGRLRIYRNVGSDVQPRFDGFEWFTASGRIAGVPRCCLVAFTPQLVDLDGDRLDDILTGSGYAGEVFFFRRRADQTFDEAELLQNSDGQVRMHRWSLSGKPHARRYNVTALAYDWDDDGDADLVLGLSPLCLVLNKGTTRQPSFDGGRVIVCNGESIRGGLGSPHMADWDGDGLDDLVAGARRRIVWYRNVGERGRPEFESPRLLIAPRPSNETPEGQPGFHYGFCVADFNSDGLPDLLVGDRLRRPVEIREEEREQTSADRERLETLRERYNGLRDEPRSETRAERIKRYRQLLHSWQEYASLRLAGSTASSTRYEDLGHVWYYERIAR